MSIGTSLVLIAVGAILRYAITADVEGIELSTVGLILIIVGVIGLILSLIWMASHRDRVVSDGVARERVVRRDRDVY